MKVVKHGKSITAPSLLFLLIVGTTKDAEDEFKRTDLLYFIENYHNLLLKQSYKIRA
jgi:hypothetical protein